MNIFKTLFKDTFVYGLAMVLPKLVTLLLNGLYTEELSIASFSENTTFYVYIGFANVALRYGMETAFFRFFSQQENKARIYTTGLLSLFISTFFFLIIAWLNLESLSIWLKISELRLQILLAILVLDTFIALPFVYYRITGNRWRFASAKFLEVGVTIVLSLFFFLIVPKYNIDLPKWIEFPKVFYIFITNLIAVLFVFLFVFPDYLKYKWEFDKKIVKQMLNYGLPIMVSGIAFVLNEHLDKLVIRDYLGKDIMGAYSGCYKLVVFLTLFIQAFRMGVEPFVFNQAKSKNAKETYAIVLKFFVIFASLGILIVLSFLDFLKEVLIRDESYWMAIRIIPVILLANWCLGVYMSLSVWYKLTDKTRYGMYFSILGAIITIVINYTFVPIYGFMAAAYATLVAYGSMMIGSYLIGQRYYNIPYQLMRLLGYLIAALTLSVVTYFLFPQIFIFKVLAILIYLTIIAIFEKNSIKRIFLSK